MTGERESLSIRSTGQRAVWGQVQPCQLRHASADNDLVRPKSYKCNGGEYGSCLPVTLTHPDHTQLLPHTRQDLPVHVWGIPKKWLHFYQTSEELRLEKTTKQS